MKKLILISALAILILAVAGYFYFAGNKQVSWQGSKSSQNISGRFRGDQTWSGEILITGDVGIGGNLTILPGTVVRFDIGDDQHSGEEIGPDGFNDSDPTRLIEYEKTHSGLYVSGKLIAVGTSDKQIVFTSAAEKPNYADWVSIGFGGDGSIIEYCIVEWSRNSITPGRNQPNTIIRIWEAGHEGIDVQGGNPTIENNVIHNAHAGIVILSGLAIVRNNTMINVGNGIHVGKEGATPILENNNVELAPNGSTKEWRYGNFAYKMREEK